MRILFLNNFCGHYGGVEQVVAHTAAALARRRDHAHAGRELAHARNELLHSCPFGKLTAALTEIENLDCVNSEPVVFRIENLG